MEGPEEMEDPFGLNASGISLGSFDSKGKEEEETEEVDLGDTTFEVLRPELREDAFGDLPAEDRKTRFDVEQHFIAAKPDQKHHDCFSHPFVQPDKCFLVGTNGFVSWAFQSQDYAEPKTVEEKDKKDSLAIKVAESDAYGKVNPSFGYKTSCAGLEQNAFYYHNLYTIHLLTQATNAKLMSQEFQAIAMVDPSLVGVMRMLGPKISKAMKTLPEYATPKPIQSQNRPGGCYASVEHTTHESVAVQEITSTALIEFRLLTCETPYMKKKMQAAKMKKKNELKVVKPKWQDAFCSFKCVPGTVPSASFNETHFTVLYQPGGKRGLMRLCVYEIAKGYKKPVRTFDFYFPEAFSQEGMLCTTLGVDGMYAVSLSSGALVLNALSDETEPGMHVISLVMADEAENNFVKRRITSISFAKDQPSILVLGTDKGECYMIEWATGDPYNIEHTPAVEPIFSASMSNNYVFAASVMGLLICRPSIPIPLFMDMDRPLAFDTCGSLIFVMTKYGGLKFFHKTMRKVVHCCEPVSQKQLRLNGIQHAYAGLKAFQDRVVCVYPNGVVRNYQLIK